MKPLLLILFISLSLPATLFAQSGQTVVYFQSDRHTLTPESKEILVRLADTLKRALNYEVQLVGHTDNIGSEKYNEQLAKRRVQSVSGFLLQQQLNRDHVKSDGFGEKHPVSSNTTATNRQKNRRVEIRYTMAFAPEVPAIDSSSLVKTEPPFENDTIIRGKNGTELIIRKGTFYPKKVSEIEFKITEALTRTDMILQGLSTVDVNGNCLASGGMVFITATANGQPINPLPDSSVDIRIPTTSPDLGMQLYRMQDSLARPGWAQTTGDVTVDKMEKGYYEFRNFALGGFNMDKILPSGENSVAIVVKSRKRKYGKAPHLSHTEYVSVVKGDVFKPKKTRFPICASNRESYFIAVFPHGDNYYVVCKPLKELRYSMFRDLYIIRKRDYVLVNKEELQELLSRVLDKQ